MLKMNEKYDKQHKMVKMLLEQIFKVSLFVIIGMRKIIINVIHNEMYETPRNSSVISND